MFFGEHYMDNIYHNISATRGPIILNLTVATITKCAQLFQLVNIFDKLVQLVRYTKTQ